MRTAPGALLYVFMDWRHLFEMLTAARALDLRLINICVWNKSNGGMGSLYRSKHELVLVLRLGAEPHRNNVELGKHGRSRANVWDYPGVNVFRSGRTAELAMHPTVKPVALIADAIRQRIQRLCNLQRQEQENAERQPVDDALCGNGSGRRPPR